MNRRAHCLTFNREPHFPAVTVTANEKPMRVGVSPEYSARVSPFQGQRRGYFPMKTIWRKPTTNVAQRGGMSYTSVIQRASSGYVWRLMIHDEMVVSGTARNRTACLEAIKNEKSIRKETQ